MNELENICVGHTIPRNERCVKCKVDEYNFNCPDYRNPQTKIPILIKLEVIDDGKKI
jgi:hypothetical protein